MNAVLSVVTLNESSISAVVMGGIVLSVLVLVIIKQFDGALREQSIAMPRRFLVALVIAIMLAVALRIVLPGAEVVAFASQ